MEAGIWLRGPSPQAQGILAKAVPGVCGFPWGCGLILPVARKAIGVDGNSPDVKPSCAN